MAQPTAPTAPGSALPTPTPAASTPAAGPAPSAASAGSGVPSPAPVIDMRRISRVYSTGRLEVAALRGVDVTVGQGEFVAIVGPSGSGKTTLMNLIGCLDRPTAGTYRLAGKVVAGLDDDALAQVRSRMIGFVFQSFNLLPRTSALENVATPLLYQGVPRRERLARARAALERLGLGDRLQHEPSELSGGQQQRVAIARAIVTEPALVLADEPTGNLDSATGADVMQILQELNDAGRTIVLITHDLAVAAHATRQIHTLDGRIVA
jgi:putative ABC transport system ATP-binding protein